MFRLNDLAGSLPSAGIETVLPAQNVRANGFLQDKNKTLRKKAHQLKVQKSDLVLKLSAEYARKPLLESQRTSLEVSLNTLLEHGRVLQRERDLIEEWLKSLMDAANSNVANPIEAGAIEKATRELNLLYSQLENINALNEAKQVKLNKLAEYLLKGPQEYLYDFLLQYYTELPALYSAVFNESNWRALLVLSALNAITVAGVLVFPKLGGQILSEISKPVHKADSVSSIQTVLQDSCSPSMEGIFSYNGQLLSLIIGIIVLTAWIIAIVLEVNLEVSRNEVAEFHHSSLIEILWTSFPALILLCLSIPSFSLLYATDEVPSSGTFD